MSSEIVRQRAELEGVVAGRTLCDELRRVAEAAGDADAYSDEAGGGWRSLTWSQVRQRVLEVAAGLAALGLEPGERVALMLPNRSEHVLADLPDPVPLLCPALDLPLQGLVEAAQLRL